MPIATLSIDLVASVAKFEADMGRAARVAEQASARIGKGFGGIGTVFTGAVLAGAAIELSRSLVALYPSLINNVAGFQDLEEKTGASAVALASFQTAADVSGTSVETLAGLMVKLTGNLSKTNEETKGAGVALAALGINLVEFKKLAPDEQFLKIAQSLAGFEDGASKTAVALALFGKAGADALPFLKELASSGRSQIRLTAEQIKQADDYADKMAALKSELRQSAQVAALQVLPAFAALAEEFIKAASGVVDLDDAAGGLQGNTALREFAEAAVLSLAALAESVLFVIKAVGQIPASFRAVAADISLFSAQGGAGGLAAFGVDVEKNNEKVKAALAERNKIVGAANANLHDLLNYNSTKISTALKASFAEQARLRNPDDAREDQRFREAALSAKGGGKPALVFKPVGSGDKAAAEAEQVRKAQLARALKTLQDGLQKEQDALAFNESFLDGIYSAGTISLASFHSERQEIARRALEAQLLTYDREAKALQDFLDKTQDPSERIATLAKIEDAEAKAARARDQYARQAVLADQQQGQSLGRLTAQVQEFAAQVLQLQGDEAGAAQIRAQQAINAAKSLDTQSGGGRIDVVGFETALNKQNQLAQAQRELGNLSEKSAVAEERFLVAAASRGATLGETERGVYALRSAQLAQLAELIVKTDELANGASPDSPAAQFAARLRLDFERLSESVDPALDRLRNFSDQVGSALARSTEDALLNFKDLRSVVQGLSDDLARIVTRAAITEPLEANLKAFIRNATTGQGVVGEFFKTGFGVAGKAAEAAPAVAGAVGAAAGVADAAGAAATSAAQATATAAMGAFTAALATTVAGVTALGAGATATAPILASLSTGAAASGLAFTGLSTTAVPAVALSLGVLATAATAASTALALIAANATAEAGGDALGAFIAMAGFSQGGYTGSAGVTEAAGVVHGQEYVFSAPAVRKLGVRKLDELHAMGRGGASRLVSQGYANGGYVRPMQGARSGGDRYTAVTVQQSFAPGTNRQTIEQAAVRAAQVIQRANARGTA